MPTPSKPPRSSCLRLVLGWLLFLAAPALGGFVLYSSSSMELFLGLLIIVSLSLSPTPPVQWVSERLKHHRYPRWIVRGLTLYVAVFVGIGIGSSYASREKLFWLSELLGNLANVLISPFLWVQSILRNITTFEVASGIAQYLFLSFISFFGAIWLHSIISKAWHWLTAIIARLAFWFNLAKVRVSRWLNNLPIRYGRWWLWMVRNSLALALLSLLFGIPAAVQNAPRPAVAITVFPPQPLKVFSLLAVGETLYAGTPRGVYRSTDDGVSWSGSVGLPLDSAVRSLLAAGGILYAGGRGYVARSTDGGATWVMFSSGLPQDEMVLSLIAADNTLYAGTSSGVYRSINDGANWEAANMSIPQDNSVWSLLTVGGILYAGTSSGVYRSTDDGASWVAASKGLPQDNAVFSLIMADDILYAGLQRENVYRSTDGGATWVEASKGLPEYPSHVFSLITAKNTLYAGVISFCCNNGVYRSTDGGASWIMAIMGLPQDDFLYSLVTTGDTLLIGTDSGSGLYRSGNGAASWAAADLWSPIRPWVLSFSEWLQNNIFIIAIIFFPLLAFISFNTYTTLARPFGLPAWALLFAPHKLPALAKPHLLDRAYPAWATTIRAELRRWGDARPEDLLAVPWPYRRYALERYSAEQATTYTLNLRPNQLRLLNHQRIQAWDKGWHTLSRALGGHAGLDEAHWSHADSLAAQLAQTLGFNVIGEARTIGPVRAYFIAAPILRLNIPPRFPLLFLADPNPGDATVQALVDAVEVIREQGYFALVIPLEPPDPAYAIPGNLRQAISRSPHANDFIVLPQDTIIEFLMARHPEARLAQTVVAQADLATRAPFVVRGPVPEQMFFGREAEIKQLVESAPTSDFALIGNRRIGKTSLLKRAEAKLRATDQAQVLWVDCQAARTVADFYAQFNDAAQPAAPITTLESFVAHLRQMAQRGPRPILLVDEVDAVLNDDQTTHYQLAATWRALAQEGVCHFIFCGSTGLARRLRDSATPFFNFAQPLPLRYLEPATARLVLAQPLDTLGIKLDNAEALLSEALSLTSGHPNLLQKVGYELVQAVNRRGERRVTVADVLALRQSSDFAEYYSDLVWGEAGPLERLITLLAPAETFRLPALEAALQAAEIPCTDTALDAALEMLRVYAVLEKQGRDYTFIPQCFRTFLHQHHEVERLIRQQRARLLTP